MSDPSLPSPSPPPPPLPHRGIYLEIIPPLDEHEPAASTPVSDSDVRFEDIYDQVDAQVFVNTSPPPAKTTYAVPKVIFIVPYRDRQTEREFFLKHMAYVMEDYDPSYYKIWFIHQKDTRTFNRGAIKNIGFLYAKTRYPDDYASITLVMNDIDTMPKKKNLLQFETTVGTIRHFYGFDYALGGIVSITGKDFETINGFPNFWAWGYEDNALQMRAKKNNIQIDRSQFYAFNFNRVDDEHFIHSNHNGDYRNTNRGEFDRYIYGTTEGIRSIRNIQYDVDEAEHMVHVSTFDTGTKENPLQASVVHIKDSAKPYGKILSISKRRVKPVMNMMM